MGEDLKMAIKLRIRNEVEMFRVGLGRSDEFFW